MTELLSTLPAGQRRAFFFLCVRISGLVLKLTVLMPPPAITEPPSVCWAKRVSVQFIYTNTHTPLFAGRGIQQQKKQSSNFYAHPSRVHDLDTHVNDLAQSKKQLPTGVKRREGLRSPPPNRSLNIDTPSLRKRTLYEYASCVFFLFPRARALVTKDTHTRRCAGALPSLGTTVRDVHFLWPRTILSASARAQTRV